MTTTNACPKCGNIAQYSARGHLYEINCAFCGFREAGTFNPIHNFPPANAFNVQLNLGNALPTASNLLGLSKLHQRFTGLSPTELKESFLRGPLIKLGSLHQPEIDLLKRNAEALGFAVEIIE